MGQLSNAETKEVTTRHDGMTGSQTYTTNGVKEIECTDRHCKVVKFINSPRVEMRITDLRNKKHIFYFDTIILKDSVFTGMNSRLLVTRKSIRYADIKKVEVQKGAKAYYYRE